MLYYVNPGQLLGSIELSRIQRNGGTEIFRQPRSVPLTPVVATPTVAPPANVILPPQAAVVAPPVTFPGNAPAPVTGKWYAPPNLPPSQPAPPPQLRLAVPASGGTSGSGSTYPGGSEISVTDQASEKPPVPWLLLATLAASIFA